MGAAQRDARQNNAALVSSGPLTILPSTTRSIGAVATGGAVVMTGAAVAQPKPGPATRPRMAVANQLLDLSRPPEIRDPSISTILPSGTGRLGQRRPREPRLRAVVLAPPSLLSAMDDGCMLGDDQSRARIEHEERRPS
ncbi:hypothetical protein G7Z17_g4927 [Cylindrodendrum hubeiense]|uniref:Uncharacterized protein n=1 Tax=Cylindrodendrum hubeiense TaxID=595255 RepID=A0A9P5LIE5_9HYPO|nr:hypothetical protein G7Z17_g4927 [Cylindrodendrum hubeiense]